MGSFYQKITVTKGPPPGVQIDKRSWKTKVSRKPEDTHFIVAKDERIPGFPAAGVFQLLIRSSNYGAAPFGEGWSKRSLDEITDRLNDNEGKVKGRVLYAIGQGWSPADGFAAELVLGALCFHVPRLGEVEVISLDATRAIATHRNSVLQALLICAERVATECSEGERSRLIWKVSAGLATTYAQQFRFHSQTTARGNLVVLVRDGDRSGIVLQERARR